MDFVDISHHLAEPFNQIDESLKILSKKGFIQRQTPQSTIIHVTAKGIEFINRGGFKSKIEAESKQKSKNSESILDKIIRRYREKRLYKVMVFVVAIVGAAYPVGKEVESIMHGIKASHPDPQDFISIKIIDVHFLTDSSKEKNYPSAIKKLNSMIPSDDNSQSETMKFWYLRGKPIIKYSITNSNQSKSFVIQDVFIKVNDSEYLLKLSSQYDVDTTVTCPPNSSLEYSGIPVNWYVYKVEGNKLRKLMLPEEVQKIFNMYSQFNPHEATARLVILYPDSSVMTVQQPFRINKGAVQDLKPSPDF